MLVPVCGLFVKSLCCSNYLSCLAGRAGAADNTRVALHFANAAKRVTMQPHVNEVVNQKALLRKLRDEVAQLRRQLVLPLHSLTSSLLEFSF